VEPKTNRVRESRPRSPNSPQALTRAFQQKIRRLAGKLDLDAQKAAKAYRAHLRELGFDKQQASILADVTLGTALTSAAEGTPLAPFFEKVEQAGQQLAKWDIHPSRIAVAVRDYASVAGLKRPGTGAEQVVDELAFEIILRISDAYHRMRQSEMQTLFDLLRTTGESTDVYPLMRRFVESVAAFYGASAGHVFLLDSGSTAWELKASTAEAVSKDAAVSMQATSLMKRTLKKAQEIGSESGDASFLLDSGWTRRWKHFWSIPLSARGKFAGVLQLAFSARREILPRDLQLLAIAAEQTLAAAERTRMMQEIAAREQRMFDLARRMLQVEEIERRRISRELHDDAGQSLVVIRLQMELIEQSMPPDAEWRERLAEVRDITETTILHMRRLIAELSPAVLEQLGLAAGLRQLVNRFRQSYSCKVKLHIGKLPKLAGDFQIVVYRLAQECLKNISQHSGAKNVNISVSASDRVLRLRVVDDGIGFDLQQGLSRKHCFGLLGMRERVALLGGSCHIRTTPQSGELKARAKNSGTDIDIQLPIPANSPSTSMSDVVG
jgi:signal transduction histidine kinase